nr:hypothetical protein [Methanoculleus marisnigri]
MHRPRGDKRALAVPEEAGRITDRHRDARNSPGSFGRPCIALPLVRAGIEEIAPESIAGPHAQ